jgi:RNA polymerase sigma-70 factor (ECF subfamily)
VSGGTLKVNRRDVNRREVQEGESAASPTDEELVRGAKEGDRQASDALVRRYLNKAYAIAFHMCSGDREEAEDLTQEAFLRALGNIKRFRGQSSFYTWFYRILINTCLDGGRRRQRWKRVFSFLRPEEEEREGHGEPLRAALHGVEQVDPAGVLSAHQMATEVRGAVAALPERQRVAFQLKVLHGMRIAEIAQAMGLAEGTAKTHLFRAMRAVREALEEWV